VYGIIGAGFYRRTENSNRGLLAVGSICQHTWVDWWDINCANGQVQGDQQRLASFSKDAAGFNFGGGITRRLNHLHNARLYAEFRYHRAYTSDVKTIMMPFAFGLRW
jgi:hypothetical protein